MDVSYKRELNAVVITGLSGSGKTTALKILEDLGYFCVDNIPPQLLRDFLELAKRVEAYKIAVVLDIRSKEFLDFDAKSLSDYIQDLKAHGLMVLYLHASDDELLRRFKATRRHHPLTGDEILKGIHLERELLSELEKVSDYVIDTTGLSPWSLKRRLAELLGVKLPLTVRLISFSYRQGLPPEADIILDVRFLKNPHYVEHLAERSGLSEEVRNFVLSDELAEDFLREAIELLRITVKGFERQGKAELVVGIGCTGGRHRSVAIAEELKSRLLREGLRVQVIHRDLR